jgi:hypothetical protein
MRSALAILATLLAISFAAAQTAVQPPADRATQAAKTLPLKRTTGASACAAYGVGFVKVEGTGSCVKVGGSIDVGAGVSSRR